MITEKILVVDDNDDHRNAIQYLLKKQGYTVIPAQNGVIGLKEFEDHDDIRVLIVDLAMLEISGVDLLERIKNRRRPLRRIVLTAYDEELSFEKAEELKVFSYLNKPISKHSLLFTVKSAFNDLYLEEFSEKHTQLQEAIQQNKFDLILELGHNLKGSSANLSLIFLQEASFQMEMAGKERDMKKAKKALSRLKQEFKRLKDFLSPK